MAIFANSNGTTRDPSPNGLTPNGGLNGSANGHINGSGHVHTNGHGNGITNGNGFRKAPSKSHFLLPFSAHDEKTLRANYAALAKSSGNWNLADIAYTLSARRSLLQNRAFVITNYTDAQFGLPEETPSITKVPAATNPTVGFIFTGQGAQWPRMGVALMAEYPSCLATVRRLDRYLDEVDEAVGRDWSIEDILKQDPEQSLIHKAELSQPLVTALQIMIVNLLTQWNVKPRAVVGHSSGEIAAGYAAGMLTEEEAIIAAYLRGKVVAQNTATGLMMAVGGLLSEIQPLVDEFDGKITVACHNSPESHTLSGDADAILQLKATLDEKKIFCRTLQTNNNAYHSDHMKALGSKYENDLNYLMPRMTATKSLQQGPKARINQAVFFSSVYGHAAPWSVLGAKYWRQNLESPVLFHQAVTEMVSQASVDLLVEIGPHSALQGPLRQLSKSMDGSNFPAYYAAISRGSDNSKDILTLAGNLFTRGYDVDLARVNAVESRGGNQLQLGKVITDLPRYQWQYPNEINLYENRWTREWRLRMHPRHDILGSRIPGTNKAEPLWRNKLIVKNVPWLADHRVSLFAIQRLNIALY
jgi:acyl transferase domain-containing protein